MEDFYWFGLKAVPGVGNVTFRRLLERFDAPGAALAASPKELGTVRGVTPAVVEAIREGAWKRFADEECRRLAGSGARLVGSQPSPSSQCSRATACSVVCGVKGKYGCQPSPNGNAPVPRFVTDNVIARLSPSSENVWRASYE